MLDKLAADLRSEASLAATLQQAVPAATQTPGNGEDGFSLAEYLADAGADVQVTTQFGQDRVLVEIGLTPGAMPLADAAAWANALTRRAADTLRHSAHARAVADHQQAVALARQARDALAAQRAEVDAFFRRHWEQLSVWAAATDALEAAEPAAVLPEVLALQTRLGAELATLRQQRAEMLVDRTPLHPDVQQIDEQIAAREEELAAAFAAPSGPPRQAAAPSGAVGLSRQECDDLAARYQGLSDGLGAALVGWEQSSENERVAWEETQATPSVDLELANLGVSMVPSVVAKPVEQESRPGWLALLALGALASGAGILWAGIVPRPVLESPSEIQSELGVPVVAVVSAPSASGGVAWYRRRRIRPWAVGVGGVCLVAALMAAIAWMG